MTTSFENETGKSVVFPSLSQFLVLLRLTELPKNLRVEAFDTECLQVGTNAGVRDSSLFLGLLLPVGPDSDLDPFESRFEFSGD
jgi:hypothetical protein